MSILAVSSAPPDVASTTTVIAKTGNDAVTGRKSGSGRLGAKGKFASSFNLLFTHLGGLAMSGG